MGEPLPAPAGQGLPTFLADRNTPDSGQIVLNGEGVASGQLRLYVRQNVVPDPVGADLRLRIDSAAQATVTGATLGSVCGVVPADVDRTANPGEWRLHRTSFFNCAQCQSTNAPVFTVDVHVGTSGTWRLSLAGGFEEYGHSYDVRGCAEEWRSAQALFGGRVTVPQ